MTTYYDLHDYIKTQLDLQSYLRQIVNSEQTGRKEIIK